MLHRELQNVLVFVTFLFAFVPTGTALTYTKGSEEGRPCLSEDLHIRIRVHNKLAGICKDKCNTGDGRLSCMSCISFVSIKDSSGVLMWDELLQYMEALLLSENETLKFAHEHRASLNQTHHHLATISLHSKESSKACQATESMRKALFQQKLAGICVDMCKEIGRFPECRECKGYEPPKKEPGPDMPWDDLLDHMDNLSKWGHSQLKSWRKVVDR